MGLSPEIIPVVPNEITPKSITQEPYYDAINKVSGTLTTLHNALLSDGQPIKVYEPDRPDEKEPRTLFVPIKKEDHPLRVLEATCKAHLSLDFIEIVGHSHNGRSPLYQLYRVEPHPWPESGYLQQIAITIPPAPIGYGVYN